MTDARIVLTTAGSEQEARRIGNELIAKKLAACVSIMPKMESIYIWEGKTEESQEQMLIIKTTKSAFEKVRDTVKEMHSYETAEVLCLAVEEGSEEYLDWIKKSVESGEQEKSEKKNEDERNERDKQR